MGGSQPASTHPDVQLALRRECSAHSAVCVVVQGAPEYVIKRCGRYFYRNKEHVMDDDFSEDMHEAYNSFGTLAERVIGHAFKVRAHP